MEILQMQLFAEQHRTYTYDAILQKTLSPLDVHHELGILFGIPLNRRLNIWNSLSDHAQ